MVGSIFIPATAPATSNSPLNGVHKASIGNNTNTALFSFPLAAGEVASFNVFIKVISQKAANPTIVSIYNEYNIFANGAGTLHSNQNSVAQVAIDTSGGSASKVCSLTYNLAASVVTVSVLTPDFVTPDTIDAYYTIENPKGITITNL